MSDNNKRNISISGTLGSGKSTIANLIMKDYDYNLISAGTIMRKLALEKSMNINEFVEFIKDKPYYDNVIDDEIKKIGVENSNMIFDSRIGWYLVPESLKIFLHCNDEISAKRIHNDNSRINESFGSFFEAKVKIKERFINTILRLNYLYQIDILNKNNYDLYIDTSYLSIDEVYEQVNNAILNHCLVGKRK